jgi:hypothetical protein
MCRLVAVLIRHAKKAQVAEPHILYAPFFNFPSKSSSLFCQATHVVTTTTAPQHNISHPRLLAQDEAPPTTFSVMVTLPRIHKSRTSVPFGRGRRTTITMPRIPTNQHNILQRVHHSRRLQDNRPLHVHRHPRVHKQRISFAHPVRGRRASDYGLRADEDKR